MKDSDLNERDAQTGHREIDAADGLVEATRAYFASGFPNAERAGCPPRETLKMAVRSNRLPGDELRAHLFTCSECFNEFRIARQAHQEHLRPAVGRFWLPIPQPRAAFAAVILFLLASVSVLLVVRPFGERPAPPVAILTDSGDEAGESRSVAGKQVSGGASAQTQESSSNRSQPAVSSGNRKLMSAISIDLRRFTPLGAAGREPGEIAGHNQNAIHLPASGNRLSLNLPAGSAKGIYVVSIVERAFLKTLVSERARTSDGKSLSVTLDMRTVKGNEYLLAISREGESPAYYRLIVKLLNRAAHMNQ